MINSILSFNRIEQISRNHVPMYLIKLLIKDKFLLLCASNTFKNLVLPKVFYEILVLVIQKCIWLSNFRSDCPFRLLANNIQGLLDHINEIHPLVVGVL